MEEDLEKKINLCAVVSVVLFAVGVYLAVHEALDGDVLPRPPIETFYLWVTLFLFALSLLVVKRGERLVAKREKYQKKTEERK